MIVWGGSGAGGTALDTGAVFDQPTQAWRQTATTNQPAARHQHTAVWARDRMLVWGGFNPGGTLGDGGSYVPPVDGSQASPDGVWTAIPASGVIAARRGHSAIWTGSRMLVWGGLDANANPLATGASFNPANGQWTALTNTGAPSARFGHTAIWTGSKMIVFGGSTSELVDNTTVRNDGAVYDPATDTWTALPTTGAPQPRFAHDAVWTGFEMVVFGGEDLAPLISAAAYNPAKNSWRPLAPATGDPELKGAWTGQAILGFGLGGLLSLDPAPSVTFYGSL
jgi:hypothetical protein